MELPQWPDYEEPVWDDEVCPSFAERAAEQKRRHAADPQHEPKYLPADEPCFETEADTAAGPEEEEA